jgi:predicted GNAT family acetyltransferase
MNPPPIRDNAAARRLEAEENGLPVFSDYRIEEGVMLLTHVEADRGLRGTGAASRFMQGVVDWARETKTRLRPRCSYAVAWFHRHPEAKDVLEG